MRRQPFKILQVTSAVSVPTLVQVRSHAGPRFDDEDAVVVVGDGAEVGLDVPHQPS